MRLDLPFWRFLVATIDVSFSYIVVFRSVRREVRRWKTKSSFLAGEASTQIQEAPLRTQILGQTRFIVCRFLSNDNPSPTDLKVTFNL